MSQFIEGIRHVVVVEDDLDSRFLFSKLIEQCSGSEVSITLLSSIIECQEYRRSFLIPADLLILDLMLLDGTGKEAYSALGHSVEGAPVLVSSAMDREFGDQLMPVVEDVPTMWMPKPISIIEFSETLYRLGQSYA